MRSRLVRRFVVADRSMEPTLVEGQGLIGTGFGAARPGQIRCLEHPHHPGFWLVKRVCDVGRRDGEPVMDVRSDNDAVATDDSRRFGNVPVAGSFRVVVRIPRRWM